jgi:hypothetical protein
VAQIVTLALFIAYTTLAAIRFRLEPSTEKSAPLIAKTGGAGQ